MINDHRTESSGMLSLTITIEFFTDQVFIAGDPLFHVPLEQTIEIDIVVTPE